MQNLDTNYTNNSNNFQVQLFEKIKILDRNDNGPKFLKSYYEFSIKENFIGHLNPKQSIKAFDFDIESINSKITYRINEKNNASLGLAAYHIYVNESLSNNNYPALMIKNQFDFETNGKIFEFYLEAYDSNNLTDSTLICLKIIDQNDNSPLFMNENSTFYVKENIFQNSFIGQVIAIDNDSFGPNSDISFRFVSKSDASIFKIYKSGVISNKVNLDREKQNFYAIQIEAYDFGEPSLSKTAYFYIQIGDVNDNKPYFIYPNETLNYKFIKTPMEYLNNSKKLLNLIDIKAFDNDLELNAKLNYFIESTSDDVLEINHENGSVYLDLDKFNKTNRFKNIVHANFKITDSGNPAQKTNLNFTFYLNHEMNETLVNLLNTKRINLIDATIFDHIKLIEIVSNSFVLISLLIFLIGIILLSSVILICFFKKALKHSSKNKLCCFSKFSKLIMKINSKPVVKKQEVILTVNI
jgi:hypothetical protein